MGTSNFGDGDAADAGAFFSAGRTGSLFSRFQT
jgi:hypothetical protein